jgi:hypothetical protein
VKRVLCWNSNMPTTASQASVTTGTAIKTMLQIATPATNQIQLISWGFSCDDPPGADSVFELCQTDVAATVTAHTSTGLILLDPNAPASLMTLGTSATGYAASAEGTPTAVRVFDAISMSSISAEASAVMNYRYQWMPDERPIVAVSKFLRVRATTPTTAVDLRCFVVWDE